MQPPPVTGRVRLIFIGAIALLIAQTLFINRYGEPYPALVMPTFHGSGAYQDGRLNIVQHEVVFEASGQTHTFPLAIVLQEFPDSVHGDIAELIFRLRGTATQQPAATEPEARFLDVVFPGYAARRTCRDQPENVESLRDWLRRRGEALLPGLQISRVEIRRILETIPVNEDDPKTNRKLIGSMVVTWEGNQR